MPKKSVSASRSGIPPPEFGSGHLDEVARLGRGFLASENSLPPRDVATDELRRRLGIEIEREGLPAEQVLERLEAVLSATPSSASPRFLNQLFGGRDALATIAEMLVPLPNSSMYTLKVAGAQVLVELEVLSKMLDAVGFSDGEGMFSPGGSLANLTAMMLARNEAAAGVRESGLDGRRLTVYTSDDAHYSIPKAAGILGIGRANVRRVPTDRQGRMLVPELERLLAADRKIGHQPMFINATAGTTVLGAVDPLAELADLAAREGVWMHIDGALAGSLALSSRYRHLLAGCERAASLTWNAHKMMGVPLPCSVLLVRERGLLSRHLGETAGYLFQTDEAQLNPGTRSLQCGRRNDALKLWTAWQLLGDAGYDRRLTRLVDLARFAAARVRDDPDLDLLHEPMTVNVCFATTGAAATAVCDHLDRQGLLKIGHGSVRGRSAVRLVCVDPALEEERILAVLSLIKKAAAQLAGS